MKIFDNNKLNEISRLMQEREETIAVAESVTAGLLQLSLAQAPGASKFYQGGIGTYNLGQKYRHLHVEPIHAQSVNCVSQKVSDEMAINVCHLFNCDWGIGVTGYATAVPESGNDTFAFYSIVFRGNVVSKAKVSATMNEPFKVQLHFVSSIIDELCVRLGQVHQL